MPRKANYPDWVTAHLEKGVYVNRVGDKYYLYKAHSERKKGDSHPTRVFDGYVGSVTEKDGLVPAKVAPSSQGRITALDYAAPLAVDACTGNVLSGLRKTYRRIGTLVYVCSILEFLYGAYSLELYESSWLSVKYPGVKFPDEMSRDATQGVERGARMVSDKVSVTYGDDWKSLRGMLAPVVLIRIGDSCCCPELPPAAVAVVNKYQLDIHPGKEKKDAKDII
ncbi:MAG: hypothetical protein IKM73_06680 [Acidaminococcaceae bacterium]|nr:hypothetical protein [Acidaminococcaceae bacterium]